MELHHGPKFLYIWHVFPIIVLHDVFTRNTFLTCTLSKCVKVRLTYLVVLDARVVKICKMWAIDIFPRKQYSFEWSKNFTFYCVNKNS